MLEPVSLFLSYMYDGGDDDFFYSLLLLSLMMMRFFLSLWLELMHRNLKSRFLTDSILLSLLVISFTGLLLMDSFLVRSLVIFPLSLLMLLEPLFPVTIFFCVQMSYISSHALFRNGARLSCLQVSICSYPFFFPSFFLRPCFHHNIPLQVSWFSFLSLFLGSIEWMKL